MPNNILVPNIITKSSSIELSSNLNLNTISIISNHYDKLADIFITDLKYIEYNSDINQFAYTKLLKHMMKCNKDDAIMKILGHVAEAVVVRRCNTSSIINKKWLDVAFIWRKYPDKFSEETIAIGTGLDYTKSNYKYFYKPQEPQFDIIWINKETEKILLNANDYYGDYIGLQVKTSGDGEKYIIKTLKNYKVPLIYFDIFNDFQKIAYKIQEMQKNEYIRKNLYGYFISAKEVDVDAYYEVCEYYKIIKKLYDNKISAEDFINLGSQMNNLGSSVVKTITEHIQIIENSIMV
ncbi:MAG: hypothetical protein K2K91_03085 [Ruminococcus sp.]|nr:hypothetical protein [Ruminococcus sp.]